MLLDSHAHLTSEMCVNEAPLLVETAKSAGVATIINICTDRASLDAGLELRKKYPTVYNAGATTPHDVLQEGETNFEYFAEHARTGNLIAVGETGLDYFYEHSPKDLQQHFLIKYLKLALECKLPVIIHCREAFQDLFKIIDTQYTIEGRPAPGVLHCFTGTLDEARQVLERGWYISISGIITYKKSDDLRAVAKEIPLERLFVETDTPFLAPQKWRGQKNQPAYLVETVRTLAEVKGISLEDIAHQTELNARSFFRI